MDDLPNYFDVIVVGTGMPECIIAAAAARVGKKVLHMDRNGYYGGDWASFSFDKFLEWIDEHKPKEQEATLTPLDLISALASLLRDEENLVTCPTRSKTITNLCCKSYVKDKPDPSPMLTTDPQEDTDIAKSSTDVNNSTVIDPADEVSLLPSSSESAVESEDNTESEPLDVITDPDNDATNQSAQAASSVEPLHQEWTISSFIENRRKFNIDLAPKIMFSRGSLVELLISSNIARYAEFQCITRVLTHLNGRIEQVPCSRADVFSTKNVTVVEKRMLMKFLTFCLKFEEQLDEFKDFEDKPFVEFLRSKKLTSNVEHYVVHAIAMVDQSCSTLQGLKATQKFLQSLGRYGRSPFLCTCYGSAELPQCFCRLCAVYEGMYYLKRKVDGIIFNNDRCHSIVSMGQRIGCEWLVMESSYAPTEFYASNIPPQRISKAILITDASLCPSEKKENTLLKLPPSAGIDYPVTVIELSSKNYVCPEDLYLVYLSCRSSNPTAEDDLKAAVELMFATNSTGISGEGKQDKRPNLLWSVYYNQRDTSTLNLNARHPEGVFLVSSPDVELDYEHAVKEAHDIFELICPGEEFLPRAPDPEDILIECHNNPGDEGEGGKIENDVNEPEANAFSEEKQDVIDEECKENTQEPDSGIQSIETAAKD